MLFLWLDHVTLSYCPCIVSTGIVYSLYTSLARLPQKFTCTSLSLPNEQKDDFTCKARCHTKQSLPLKRAPISSIPLGGWEKANYESR